MPNFTAQPHRFLNILQRNFQRLAEKFWVVPAFITSAGIGAAEVLVRLDRTGRIPDWMIQGEWVYTGSATGARTLLGVVASSTIGVAGTVFSITIAALTLAAGQMGPRLLRNFTNDRGNQISLGIFLGTFSFALMVLRSVRTADEGRFVPHVALSVGILLAFLSVATLVYFVGHMAGRINVDTVIELVSDDMRAACDRLIVSKAQAVRPADAFWNGGALVIHEHQGYLQSIDRDRLIAGALAEGISINLFVRPGQYVFPGTTVAVIKPATKEAAEAIGAALLLGPERVSAEDIEFPIRQLVEVAVRALSPGINDPRTAMSVLDRLGAALCDLEGRYLPTGVTRHDDGTLLVVANVDYDGLTDAMFHMIRQNARGSTPVLIRLLEVLTAVAGRERDPARLDTLHRHAGLVMTDALRDIETPGDIADVRRRHAAFTAMRMLGPVSLIGAKVVVSGEPSES